MTKKEEKEDYLMVKGVKYIREDKTEGHWKSWKVIDMVGDKTHVSAFGTFLLDGGSYNVVRISIEYLKKAITMLETLDLERAVIAIADDRPIIIGDISERDPKRIVGYTIAPRVEDD